MNQWKIMGGGIGIAVLLAFQVWAAGVPEPEGSIPEGAGASEAVATEQRHIPPAENAASPVAEEEPSRHDPEADDPEEVEDRREAAPHEPEPEHRPAASESTISSESEEMSPESAPAAEGKMSPEEAAVSEGEAGEVGTDGKSPTDPGAKAKKKGEKPEESNAHKFPETRNREWIIKMEDEPVAPKTPEVQLDWTDPAQRKRCEGYRKQLRDLFVRTRYYSIQGDACATADHAKSALELAETCRSGCPKGFLEASGYNGRILRNWRWLRELGANQCMR